MKKIVPYSALGIASAVAIALPSNLGVPSWVTAAASKALVALGFLLLDGVIERWGEMKWWLWTAGLRRQTEIRFSISYLIRIKHNGRYLLVRGHRIKDQFQPVGGVYKRYPGSGDLFRKIEVLDDNHIAIDDDSRDDLRVRVKGANAPRLLKWFRQGYCREIGPWREFDEEMLESKILNRDDFKGIGCEYIRQVVEGPTFSKYAGTDEVLVADIFSLVCDSDQARALSNIESTPTGDVAWATEAEIKNGEIRIDPQTTIRIARTAQWIL